MLRSSRRVLVLGGSGLLGSAVVVRFVAEGDVVGATYNTLRPHYPCEWSHLTASELLWSVEESLSKILSAFKPDLVINCLRTPDPSLMLKLHSLVPLILESKGQAVIHISTNAVFQARKEPWCSEDVIQPQTPYEWSKALGERPSSQLVVRTTFVGRNLFTNIRPTYRLAAQDVLWNGVTNLALARWLWDRSGVQLKGLEHVHSDVPLQWNDVVRFLQPDAVLCPDRPNTTGQRLLRQRLPGLIKQNLLEQLVELSD